MEKKLTANEIYWLDLQACLSLRIKHNEDRKKAGLKAEYLSDDELKRIYEVT